MHGIEKLARAARANPQSAFSAFQCSVKQEWQYLQRTTPNIEACFDRRQEEFLPALFGEAIDDYRIMLTHLPVRYSGLTLPAMSRSSSAPQIRYHQ